MPRYSLVSACIEVMGPATELCAWLLQDQETHEEHATK